MRLLPNYTFCCKFYRYFEMSFKDFADFSVPRFEGFNIEPENEEVETYFEYNHESNYLSISETTSSRGDDTEETTWHPSEDIIYGEFEQVVAETVEVKYSLRKSMSTGDLKALENYNIKHEPMSPMQEEQTTKGHLNKHRSLSRLNVKTIKSEQYVSVAEKMNTFWTRTPERFRSQPKLNGGPRHLATMPKTPNLTTKNRSRPLNILSREQLEEIEIEEAKRHPIKAHPVNPKVMQDPKFLPVEKKPVTKVKPFKLTEMNAKKKEGPLKAIVPQFHANPVPKSVYEKPKDLRPVPAKVVVPKARSRSASREKVSQDGDNKARPSRTDPKPFSFDRRDKELVKRREALISKVLEEEKRAREFHARPIPKAIVSNKGHNGSTSSLRSNKSDGADSTSAPDSSNYRPKLFKATSPRVLHQKPFVPKKTERTLVEVTEFQLNTQLRAREREEYEAKKREREEMAARYKLENEMRQKQMELEEIARLRKEMEHKANPIRRFKQLPDVQPAPLTMAVSPKFMSGKSNKENVNL